MSLCSDGRKPLAPKGYKSSKEECVTQDDTIDVVLGMSEQVI